MDLNLVLGVVMFVVLCGCMVVLYRRKPNQSQRSRADDFLDSEQV